MYLFFQVRELWKQLDDFEHSEAAEREVIASIVERTINKHRIDASDITVKVPDMLLRECADEIRRVSPSFINYKNPDLHIYVSFLKLHSL